MIERYKFGFIVIEGKRYKCDVEVRWQGDVLEWQRKESHIIDVDSAKRAVDENPETIVIGTGAYGVAKVLEETRDFISKKNIKLEVFPTKEAVKIFNAYQAGGKKVIGLFHLTC
ncbi:hypothetical protein J7J81_02160 [bacterium]|nr:hypothetical protein [bacterium]